MQLRVVEFSADAWQASAPHLNRGLGTRMEAVSELLQGVDALAASRNISGLGADGMRAYIREVHGPILQSLLVALSTFQTAVGVYWRGYAQVDTDGNFRLVRDEFEEHLTRLESGMGELRGFADQLRRIAADASHLVSLGGAGARAAEQTVAELESMHRLVKGQKETWEAYEAADPGFGQVEDLVGELRHIIANVGSLTVGTGRSYVPGSFQGTTDKLAGLTSGMVDYCRDNQQAAAAGWDAVFAEYAEDLDRARREQAGWALIGDAVQIAAGVLVTAIGLGLTPFTGGVSLGLTVLGGSLLIGGINSAINHGSIWATGDDLNFVGNVSDAVSAWYQESVVKPAAESGSWGAQFLAGLGAGLGGALSGAAGMNVHEMGQGVTSLFTDQAARDAWREQFAGTAAKVAAGDGFTVGELSAVLIPGAAAGKAARAGGHLPRGGGRIDPVRTGNPTGDLSSAHAFASPDPHVSPAASALESEMPGSVKGVNTYVTMDNGLQREVDIDLGDVVIQVKGGNARGLGGQIQRTTESTGRKTVGYAPEMPGGAWRRQRGRGFRSLGPRPNSSRS